MIKIKKIVNILDPDDTMEYYTTDCECKKHGFLCKDQVDGFMLGILFTALFFWFTSIKW